MKNSFEVKYKEMPQFKLSDIYVGKSDGEAESKDNRFVEMFYTKNNKFNEAMEIDKFIISGRKGTGKTILAKYIINNFHNPEKLKVADYEKISQLDIDELIEFSNSEVSSKERKTFYTFFVYKQIVKVILKNKIRMRWFFNSNGVNILSYFKFKKDFRKLQELYEDRYNFGIYKTSSLVKRQTIKSSSESSAKANLSVSLTASEKEESELSVEEKKELSRFYEWQETMYSLVHKILRCLDIIMVFDDFDDIDYSKTDKKFLVNFIKCVRDINFELRDSDGVSKCILLIRNDILATVDSRDTNIQKTITDSNVTLDWTEKKSFDDLIEMILNKIKNSNKNLKQFTIDQIKEIFFSSDIEKIFKRFLDNSFGRPRDIVTYINEIRKNHPNESKISMDLVKKNDLSYSKAFLGELKNEMSSHLDDEKINEIFNFLKDMGRVKFSIKVANRSFASHIYTKISSVENILNELYRFGAVGYYVKNTNKNFNDHYWWAYRDNATEDIDTTKMMCVHYGLLRILNLK